MCCFNIYYCTVDPRSPSLAIPRTPLSLTEKPQVAVNKVCSLKNYCLLIPITSIHFILIISRL